MQANKTADNQYLIPLIDGTIENIDITDGILLTTSEFVSQEDIEMTTTHDDLSLFQISFCIPLPSVLTECLREAKEVATSEYVVANRDGGPLSYTQFKRVWQYIVTRSTKERTYVRYINGQKIQRTVTPKLGEKAAHNGNVVYTLDFQVTPHQLRHTYITNLIYSGADPKTVQYLAGHKHSKITMDIYAKVKYNKPKELSSVVNKAFAPKKGATPNKTRNG